MKIICRKYSVQRKRKKVLYPAHKENMSHCLSCQVNQNVCVCAEKEMFTHINCFAWNEDMSGVGRK